MSADKKRIRRVFREAVFARALYCCEWCGRQGVDRQGGDSHVQFHAAAAAQLDAHHITPREAMPNGGYVAENGISLCEPCHLLAESALAEDVVDKGLAPARLYERIGSSHELAFQASTLL